MVVLDRSGSMADANKIAAARNGATLLTNELADSDQGGYVSFDTNAIVNRQLKPMTAANRGLMEGSIGGALPGASTSIGDGLFSAAAEHDARKDPEHACSFVLLSDGYENEAQYWATVKNQVTDNGCAIHSVALGPEANEPLMQQIGASVPGGSYDYADVGGVVPVGSSGSGAAGGGGAGGAPVRPRRSAGRTTSRACTTSRPPSWPTASGWRRSPASVTRAAGTWTRRSASRAACRAPRSLPARPFTDNQVKVGVDGKGRVGFGTARRAGGAGVEATLMTRSCASASSRAARSSSVTACPSAC